MSKGDWCKFIAPVMIEKTKMKKDGDNFFDADDYQPYGDFSFVVIDGNAYLLTDIATVGSYNATNWDTFEYTVTSTGSLEIGFGAINE